MRHVVDNDDIFLVRISVYDFDNFLILLSFLGTNNDILSITRECSKTFFVLRRLEIRCNQF